MASKKRKSGAPIKDRLFEKFYGFSFFKAVALLESLFPEKKPLGQTLVPEEEAIRFSVNPGFTFPPSDISGLDGEKRIPGPADVDGQRTAVRLR